MATAPNAVRLTPAQHRVHFAEFVRWETACGGPDPHMAYVGALLGHDAPTPDGCDWYEHAWRLGCYLACYNVPTGIVLWTHWPFGRPWAEPDQLEAWIVDNWDGLAFRRERRAVRSAPKLARHLLSLHAWIGRLPYEPWLGTGDYNAAWRSAGAVYGVGRYIKHKLLEGLYRYCGIGVQLNDIRAKGAWSPRGTLALLYPEHAELLAADTPAGDETAEMCAAWARADLAGRGLPISWYDLQVMLCEYRESIESRRQYPGRSHDSELGYYKRLVDRWSALLDDPFTLAREACVPEECRGELHGWDGPRPELGEVLADYGYTWTDLRFDFVQSRYDLAHPVQRAR